MFLIIFYYFALFLVVCKLFVHWTGGVCTSQKCLKDKTAIVTGGSSGLGYETALDLAKRGCKVIIACSSNAEHIVKKIIEETGNEKIFLKRVNLGSLESVRKFADNVLSTENQLDILINNAAALGFNGILTDDGLLKTMQINHLGPFLLTHLLIGLLKKSQGRILFVSSMASMTHQLNFDNINATVDRKHMYSPDFIEYANTKLCNIITAKIFARKLKQYGVLCFSLHPGLIWTPIYLNTYKNGRGNLGVSVFYWMFYMTCSIAAKNVKQGIQTILHCALSDDVKNLSGKYFVDCRVFWPPFTAAKDELCEKVWKASEDLVHLQEHEKIL